VDIPVLAMHGEDDHVVPFELTGAKVVKFLRNGKLISYPVFRTGCQQRRLQQLMPTSWLLSGHNPAAIQMN